MKWPLSWHKENLRNRNTNLHRAARDAERAAAYHARMLDEIAFLERQIAEAEKRGLNGFDPERFLVKRVKKDG